MAQTLYHNDGTSDICIARTKKEKEEFFEQMLEERLGKDAAQMFHNIIVSIKEDY